MAISRCSTLAGIQSGCAAVCRSQVGFVRAELGFPLDLAFIFRHRSNARWRRTVFTAQPTSTAICRRILCLSGVVPYRGADGEP